MRWNGLHSVGDEVGLFRKTMSLSSMGFIDWRDHSERAAAAERKKAKNYKQRTKKEAELAERELALREREVRLAERQAGIAPPPPEPKTLMDHVRDEFRRP